MARNPPGLRATASSTPRFPAASPYLSHLEDAYAIAARFYGPAATRHLEATRQPELPFRVLGVKPPRDFCWLTVGSRGATRPGRPFLVILQRQAPGEARLDFVPPGDMRLAQSPAEIDLAPITQRWEVDQPGIEVFEQDA